MNKKLPSVFVNKQNKKINNNEEMCYIKEDNNKDKKMIDEFIIKKKISEVFLSSKFIYKIKVLITTEDEIREEVLIAKTRDYLLTIDSKQIPIKSIKDIKII